MINLVRRIISGHPEWTSNLNAPLSVMKMSTPTSGRSLDKGKVLLFVFEPGLKVPTWCVKTTRSYDEAELIRRNYRNLSLLRAGVDNSALSDLFAKPLFLYDNKETIFCIESVCRGQIPSVNQGVLDLVLNAYEDWQVHLLSNSNSNKLWLVEDLRSLIKDTVSSFNHEDMETKKIIEYYDTLLKGDNVMLPALTQHGDLTPNNVLLSGDHVSIIDYDFIGISTLPGYDIFNFILKFHCYDVSFRAICERYLRRYFEKIGVKIVSLDVLFFAYYILEIKRKDCNIYKKSFEELIAGFNSLMIK
ncbi:MAG: hypothetical protein HZA95_02565 [Candidatus Vogelbacteria bacterium]|nr:hypothetical protein [Candidatus Vogelbacteria bacterium]